MRRVIVSEYVSFGHPDKLADQISDALVDEFVKGDSDSRCGIETMVKDNVVVLGGEVMSKATVNYDETVRRVFADVHYPESHHLRPQDIKIVNLVGQQSPEIHQGVDREDGEIGAGDQGFMVGYACNETATFMPLGVATAKTICNYVAQQHDMGPDAKAQVSVVYEDGKVVAIKHILVSTMHQCSLESVRTKVENAIRRNEIGLDAKTYTTLIEGRNVTIDVNPCGSWTVGGPLSDCGVTGRKIVVDNYGGYCNVGGGAYSSKDLSKVDRSAAYEARHIAKNIVAAGVADVAKVTIAYMIGVPEPCSVDIELNRNEDKTPLIQEWIRANWSLTPRSIIERFGSYPRNYVTAKRGHYGLTRKEMSDPQTAQCYPWERFDLVDAFKQFAGQSQQAEPKETHHESPHGEADLDFYDDYVSDLSDDTFC